MKRKLKKVAEYKQPKITSYKGEKSFFSPHGQGRAEHKGGVIYEGEWSAGKWSGQGKLLSKTGFNAVGSFKNGMLHGAVAMQFSNGATFRGHFSNGQAHGEGEFHGHDSLIGTWKSSRDLEGHIVRNGKRSKLKIAKGVVYHEKSGLFGSKMLPVAGEYFCLNAVIAQDI